MGVKVSVKKNLKQAREEFNEHVEHAHMLDSLGCLSLARQVRMDADAILNMRLLKIERMKAA